MATRRANTDIMSDMDDKDWDLIRELEKDARAPLAQLSRRLGVPRITLLDRLRRLRDSGVIKGFTVQLDHHLIGQGTLAFVLIRFERTGKLTQQTLAETISRLPGVEEVHIIAGEWDLMVVVRGRTLEEVGDLVIGRLRETPGVSATVTLPCFKSVKER